MFGFDYLPAGEMSDPAEPELEGSDDPAAASSDAVHSENSGALKILIAKCFTTRCVFSHVVPQKGVDPERYSVDRMVKDVMWLEHSKILLRSDNEPAIKKLFTEILKVLRVEGLHHVSENHPPAYDPSSNGAIEAACKGVGACWGS